MATIERNMQFALNYMNKMSRVYPRLLQNGTSIINTINIIDGANANNNGKIRFEVAEYREDEDKIFTNAIIDKDLFASTMTILSNEKSSDLERYYNTLNSNYHRFKNYNEKYQNIIDSAKVKKEIFERKGQPVKSFAFHKILVALLREKNALDGMYSRLGRLLPDTYR